MQVFTKQAIRLQEFIEDLGMSADGFRKSCQIKSPSSMPKILKEGKAPSLKLLKKIINTYPQLNRDWVLTGVGEMYLPQFSENNQVSNASFNASQNSQYSRINTSLVNHDFALNEVILKLQQAIAIQNEHTLLLSSKIESLNQMSMDRWKKLEERIQSDNETKIIFIEEKVKEIQQLNIKLEETRSENLEKRFSEIYTNAILIQDQQKQRADDLVKKAIKQIVINIKDAKTIGTYSKNTKPTL